MVGVNDEDATIIADVLPVYPGAVNLANLLRVPAWIVVTAFTVVGFLIGGGIGGAHADGGGFVVGVLAGAVIGALVGALYASGTFAVSYVLLLLNEIEVNTRVTASGNILNE